MIRPVRFRVAHLWLPSPALKSPLGRGSPRQRHRWLDDDFLREVARVHREAEQAGSPSLIDAVATSLGPVAYSSAQRWVAAARERGFLPPSPRGRPTRKDT